MTTRGLIAALSLGGAIIATRALGGPAVDQAQLVALPNYPTDPAGCTDANAAKPHDRARQQAVTEPAADGAAAPNQACLR